MLLLQIDAFTDQPFRGNPAGVCLVDGDRNDTWMQDVAAEMNLAETAFLRRAGDDWSLRWFTPTIEMDLCGHATLASAHALWQEGLLPTTETARFHTRSGLLTATREGNLIELDFPIKPDHPIEPPPGLLETLGVSAKHVGQNDFDYLVEVESEEIVRSLTPDLARLRTLPVRGAIVTSRSSSPDYDFVSRFFAPAAGIDEDPVTGSAHCALTPFWSQRLGKTEMRAHQASPRGGFLRVRIDGDRVKMAGHAVTVFRAELLV